MKHEALLLTDRSGAAHDLGLTRIVRLVFCVTGLMLLLPLAATATRRQETPGVPGDRLVIVATTDHLGDAVRAIAPDAWVTVLMGPGTDAHTYVPTTREAQRIEQADLVTWNGLELEVQFTGVLRALGDRGLEAASVVPHDMPLTCPACAYTLHP